MFPILLIVNSIYLLLFLIMFIFFIRRTNFINSLAYTLVLIPLIFYISSVITVRTVDVLLSNDSVVQIIYYIAEVIGYNTFIFVIHMLVTIIVFNITEYLVDIMLPKETKVTKKVSTTSEVYDETEDVIVVGKKRRKKSLIEPSEKTLKKSGSSRGSGKTGLAGSIKSLVTGIEEGSGTVDLGGNYEYGDIVVGDETEILYTGSDESSGGERVTSTGIKRKGSGRGNKLTDEVINIERLIEEYGTVEKLKKVKVKSSKDVIVVAIKELAGYLMTSKTVTDLNRINDLKNYKIIEKPVVISKDEKTGSKSWKVKVGFRIQGFEYYVFDVFVLNDGDDVKIKPLKIDTIF